MEVDVGLLEVVDFALVSGSLSVCLPVSVSVCLFVWCPFSLAAQHLWQRR